MEVEERGERWPDFQMTDESGCHGDSANEEEIWDAGLADGHESYTQLHTHTEEIMTMRPAL